MNLETLRKTDITFWTVWQHQNLLGCGALKSLSAQYAEIKSMRTDRKYLRKWVAARVHKHIILQAKARQLQHLSLETGSQTFFQPAIALYQTYDFTFCDPFAHYKDGHNSKFMTLVLGSAD